MNSRWIEMRVKVTRKFFLATVFQGAAGLLIFGLLVFLHTPSAPSKKLYLPVAFQFGTFFLAVGSYFLHRSVQYVRQEKQVLFRRCLRTALSFAVLFVGVQSYGLWCFVKGVADFSDPQQNVHGFVFLFSALHAMHFLVAQSILLWVTLCALADRYDHEYHFGVLFASWVWHVLGLVWVAILCVFGISVQG